MYCFDHDDGGVKLGWLFHSEGFEVRPLFSGWDCEMYDICYECLTLMESSLVSLIQPVE